MNISKPLLAMIVTAGLFTQAAPNHPVSSSPKQQSQQPGQQQQNGRPHQPREDFFHYSTKLVNRDYVDYGAWLEERRRTLVETSLTNPFFWYSALTTSLVMLLMLTYGVRVLNERRKLWRAAELLTDIWNQDQYSRSVAAGAVERYNAHMIECNRVVEAQISGRPSAAVLDASDARQVVESLRAELSAMESLKKEAEAQVKSKEKYISELSGRVAALEKTWDENGGSPTNAGDTVAKLVARVNLLQQQLEAERKRNLQVKGA